MNSVDFICIDDQSDEIISPLLERISLDGLSISREYPVPIDGQIGKIKEFITRADKQALGLLLDLRIDMDIDPNAQKVNYRGPALAQELRTRMAEGELRFFPIALWSVNNKFQVSYRTDESSHDLFDAVYDKDLDILGRPEEVARELKSLALGYLLIMQLIESLDGCGAVGIPSAESAVYSRFRAELEELQSRGNVADIAHFLIADLIRRSGLLVSEELFAARLGVDVPLSKESWDSLKESLQSAKYKGPFGDGWDRWWWFSIEDWWFSLFDKNDLRRLEAHERVARLNERFGFSLQAVAPMREGYSTRFFTQCFATGKPLDPVDGLRVMSIHHKEWHDTRYVSKHAALERIAKEKWRLDPVDIERLEELKEAAKDGKEA